MDIELATDSRPLNAASAQALANCPAVFWYHCNDGSIELAITLEDAQLGAHSGACDEDIAALLKAPYIAEQLAVVSEADMQRIALETGRNDYGNGDADNSDHDANTAWVLWQACWDIVESHS